MQNVNVYSYVRWSSERQSWGDSERRQEQLAKDWCSRKGVTLAERSFTDKGTSAWKGKNRDTGAFGELLKVTQPGDVILIEDNDRFSREDTVTALNGLRDTVNKGVTVVFLKTGIEVTRANFNDPSVLFPNFFQAYLANAENEKKSFRCKEAWAKRKRQVVEEHKAVRCKLPSWLQWDAQLDTPVLVEHKAQTVRKIFQLCLDGNGVQLIARNLQSTSTPTISVHRNKGWSAPFVWQILKNKSTIGFFGEVPGIYPAVVDEKTFYAVQDKISKRKHSTAPARFKESNLFSGLGFCSKCGGPLIRHTQKPQGKVYAYLVCSNSKLGTTNCGLGSVRYEVMEETFLSLLADTALVKRTMAVEQKPSTLDTFKAKLAEVQAHCEKLMQAMNDDPNPSRRVYDALKAKEVEETELQKQVDAETAKAKIKVPAAQAYQMFHAELSANTKDPGYRAKLLAALRAVVERVVVQLNEQKYAIYLKGGGEIVVQHDHGRIIEVWASDLPAA